MKKWRCSVCGYIHDGDEVGETCPKCGAPAAKFEVLGEQESQFIERARRTNMYHCKVVDLAREIEHICEQGIKDDLDPGCVDVFKKGLEASYLLMKLSSTEMQAHMKKGKWG